MTLEAREPPAISWSAEGGELPDVNVWLALALQEHPHHAAAQAYWHDGGYTLLRFCRMTMLGLVRLLCQPKVMGPAALELHDAVTVYRRFSALPEVRLCPEAPTCDADLQRLVAAPGAPLPARLWTDAYLAAFAISAGLRLVTFDRGFARFAGLNALQLATTT